MNLEPKGDLQDAQVPVIHFGTESLISNEQLLRDTPLGQKQPNEFAEKRTDQDTEEQGYGYRTQRFPHVSLSFTRSDRYPKSAHALQT